MSKSDDKIQYPQIHTLFEKEDKKYFLKSAEERIEDACRINIKTRSRFRRGYYEIRPNVIREFEEEEKRRLEAIPFLDRIVESNPLLKHVFFWPWQDECSPPPPPPDPKPPPDPPKKTCRERISDFWKSAKNCIPTKTIARYYANVKDFIRTYWERGTQSWYFDLTPSHYATPVLDEWPLDFDEVYWWPGAIFTSMPQDYGGPFAIGPWPVDDAVPYAAIQFRDFVLRQFEKIGMWGLGSSDDDERRDSQRDGQRAVISKDEATPKRRKRYCCDDCDR